MHAEPLVKMVNEIGRHFEAMPQRDAALKSVAQHLKSFWDPRMRRALLAHVDAHAASRSDDGLLPFAAAAIAAHRALIE